MHCTVKSSRYNTTIEFWRHGFEIKARTVDYVSELDDLDYPEGRTICVGGRLFGDVRKFQDSWDDKDFQRVCKWWWREYVGRIVGDFRLSEL